MARGSKTTKGRLQRWSESGGYERARGETTKRTSRQRGRSGSLTNTKYKIQNTKYKIQNTKYKIQNTKYKIMSDHL